MQTFLGPNPAQTKLSLFSGALELLFSSCLFVLCVLPSVVCVQMLLVLKGTFWSCPNLPGREIQVENPQLLEKLGIFWPLGCVRHRILGWFGWEGAQSPSSVTPAMAGTFSAVPECSNLALDIPEIPKSHKFSGNSIPTFPARNSFP